VGGYNSGRYRTRPHLGQLLRLDVFAFRNLEEHWLGSLTWQNGSSVTVTRLAHGLRVSFGVDGEPHTVVAQIVSRPCHFGGTRPLFLCPHCTRPARFIYFKRRRFVCRNCTGLRYWTQSAAPDARMAYGIRRIQRRLAPEIDPDDYVVEYVPNRPSGMRRRTYERLCNRVWALVEARDDYLEPGFVRMLAKLGALEAIG
jgi:hypothetical protein